VASSTSGRSKGSEIVGRTGFGDGFSDSKIVEARRLSPRLSFLVKDRASVDFELGEDGFALVEVSAGAIEV
jgi:hypothetical protein